MQKIKKSVSIVLCICFFGLFSATAQNSNKTPLISIFSEIEEHFDVRFSYAIEDVSTILINNFQIQKDLKSTLKYMENQAPVEFTFIDERYITVSKKIIPLHTVWGILAEENSDYKISGATIETLRQNTAVISDFDGFFELKNIPENDTLKIRHLGYRTQLIAVKDLIAKPCQTVYLASQAEKLQTIILNNIFTNGIYKTTDGSIHFQVESFGNLPGLTEPDVLQMVQTLPGVTSVDETISNISIRSGTTDENLILWDDIKLYQNGHLFGHISGFNPFLTEKVTVHKSGTHSRYGENVSGVIAMHSADSLPKSTEGGLQLNLINAGGFLKMPVNNKLSIELSARHALTDFFESPTYAQFSNKIFQDTEVTNIENNLSSGNVTAEESFSFYDVSLKSVYQASKKDRFQVNFLTIDNTLDFTKTFTSQNSEVSETSTLTQKNLAGGLSWHRKWNSLLQTNVLGYGSLYTISSSNLDIFSSQQLQQENEVLESGLKLDATLLFNTQHKLSLGYQFIETGIGNRSEVNTPLFRDYRKDVLRTHALFANHSYTTKNNKTTVNVGVRANYIAKFKLFLPEPRVHLHQKLGGGFAVEGSYEMKSQSVTQRVDFLNNFLGVEKRRWVLANDDNVPVLKSRQFTVAGLFQKNNWLFQIEGFYKHVDGITSANQGFQNQWQFSQTTGSYDTKGVEAIINKKTKNWSTWLSYTYANAEYTFNELSPQTFPHNFDMRHQATLAVSYSLGAFKFALGSNWHTGKPLTNPVNESSIEVENGQSTIVYETPNQDRLDDYLRIDFSAEYNFKLSQAISGKVNAALLNVTNRRNILNSYYIIENKTEISRVNQVSLGMTPNVSLQLLF